jgi:pathogenesis-related protein 1
MARYSVFSFVRLAAVVISFSVLPAVFAGVAPSPRLNKRSASDSDIDQYLSSHNTVREQHGAADLTWNDPLASAAQQWASGCVFQHSGGSLGSYGGKH